MIQYKETEYLYSSARVRAMEAYMVGRDLIARMTDVTDTAQVIGALSEKGVTIVRRYDPVKETETVDVEATLTGMLSDAFSTIEEIAPNPVLVKILRCVYDCNNIKAAIKANILRLSDSATVAMMIDLGTVPVADVISMPTEKNYSLLPGCMASVAPSAVDAYAATKDPRKIDLMLDRACFGDMLTSAMELGCEFVTKHIKARIDLTNYMVTVRVSKISSNASERALLLEGLVGGGKISTAEFVRAFDSDETDAFLNSLFEKNGYGAFVSALDKATDTLSTVEKKADNYLMNMLCDAKRVSFGAEPLYAYLVAMESVAKNVRIILAGKEANLERSVISKRVRDCYV